MKTNKPQKLRRWKVVRLVQETMEVHAYTRDQAKSHATNPGRVIVIKMTATPYENQ